MECNCKLPEESCDACRATAAGIYVNPDGSLEYEEAHYWGQPVIIDGIPTTLEEYDKAGEWTTADGRTYQEPQEKETESNV